MTESESPPPRPPQPPAGAPAPGPGDDGLLRRIEKLEDFATDAKERLVRLETTVGWIAANMVTKADHGAIHAELGTVRAEYGTLRAELKGDMAALEATMIKCFLATAIALAGLAFAAGRFVH